MRGLSRRAGRLGDDGAQFDRDDQLRGCGFPDLHALWSCFLRAYDALCIVGETRILAHQTSTAAGSATTHANESTRIRVLDTRTIALKRSRNSVSYASTTRISPVALAARNIRSPLVP